LKFPVCYGKFYYEQGLAQGQYAVNFKDISQKAQ